MSVMRSRIAMWVLVGALFCTSGVPAQEQSPTSPRPRPGVPVEEPQADSGGNRADDDRGSRFSDDGGRFGSTREKTPADGAQPDGKTPAIRHTRENETEVQPAPKNRVVSGRDKNKKNAPQGIVSGAPSATPASGVAPEELSRPKVAVVNPAEPATAFEPILEREVEYGPLPEGGEVLLDLMGPKTVPEFMEDIRVATLWNILISEEVREKTLEFWITEATPQQAMEIVNEDPAVKHGIMHAELYPYRVSLWSPAGPAVS